MKKILGLLLLLVIAINTNAQQYNFINYSIENGLIQSQIRAICQDDDGYIWIGTLGGLSKFNGKTFQNYSTNDGLLNNQINAIYKDSKGNLWLGTLGGVTVYKQNSFTNIIFKDSLAKNSVLSIVEDKKGNIWLATDGGGIVVYNHQTLNYITLPNSEKQNYIRSITCDDNDNKWIATREGVAIIDKKFQVVDTIKNINATEVFIDAKKQIWCSTFGNGIVKITKDSTVYYTEKDGLISNHIRAFTIRKDGTIWFVSKNGISKFNGVEFKNFTQKDGLSNNNIKCIIEDEEGNLFLGADGAGIIKFTDESFVSFTKNDGLSSDVVMSINEDENQNIWITTYDAGICKIKNQTCMHYNTNNGLANNTVWCSLIDRNNNLWLGTSNGVSLYSNNQFKSYNKEQGLNAKKVFALNEDNRGNIWIGTKKGLSVLYVSNDSIYNYDEIEGLSRNIRYIFNEDDKVIWFCSSDGLFRYDIKTHTAKKIDSSNGLPDNSVMTITKDNYGRLWIGTKNGLVVYQKDTFNTIQIADNYASNNINFLSIDEYNSLWIGTNFGLYQLSLSLNDSIKPTDFVHYSNLDGLKSLECNQNASFIDSENNLWFGTSQGLMKHSVKVKTDLISLPKVHITDIRLFFERKDLSKYSEGVDLKNLPKNLILDYNKNHLTFDFVGIYHTSPDKIRYKFKLEGFDEDWQPVTTAGFVTYSNMSSGDYQFMLSASVDAKNWTTPVTFSFTINPPFWFTWWFYLFCLVFITSITWLLIKRKQNIEQEKRATQLIMDKSKMLTLEQQALNSSMNRHFIFNALNSIQYYINRQDKISANKYLSSFAKLVRKNLDSSLVNEIYIDEEIERISLYLKLEQMRFQDKFSYQINMDPSIELQSIKIPSMLLQPFIENSIWHGILPSNKPGSIAINVMVKDNQLIIDIIDDGIGIEKSIELKKDKKQYHASKGMELTKNRIELISKISNKECLIKGPYQLEKDNKIIGTQVTIVITLSEEKTKT
jgi:ligand-binding sensor domain-containing protein